jgi:hypothetical protein
MSPVRPLVLALLGLLSSAACEVTPSAPPPRVGFGLSGSFDALGFAPLIGSDRLTFTSSFAISEGAEDLAPDDPTVGLYRLERSSLFSNIPSNLVRLSGQGFLTVIDDQPGSSGVHDALQLEIVPFQGFTLRVTLIDPSGTLLDSTLPPCTIAFDDFDPVVELASGGAPMIGELARAAALASFDNLRCRP